MQNNLIFLSLSLSLSPYNKFYIKWTPLHPNDSKELIIRIEHERLKTFYSKKALPQIKKCGQGRESQGSLGLEERS